MVIHKRTRLTPIQRQEIYESYHQENRKVSDLAVSYHVSRPTIYKIIQRGRKQDFTIHSSRNKRFTCLRYGIKRLSKIEKQIEERLRKQAKRYNKDYPRSNAPWRHKEIAPSGRTESSGTSRVSLCGH